MIMPIIKEIKTEIKPIDREIRVPSNNRLIHLAQTNRSTIRIYGLKYAY